MGKSPLGVKMTKMMFAVAFVAVLLSCAGKKEMVNTEEALGDALISFTVNAQATRFTEAINYLTYDEQLSLIDGNGNVKDEYRTAMSRVKLSALQAEKLELDSEGKIVGMRAILDRANQRFQISDKQRSMNLDQVEKRRTENKGVPVDTLKGQSLPLEETSKADPLLEQIREENTTPAPEQVIPEVTAEEKGETENTAEAEAEEPVAAE